MLVPKTAKSYGLLPMEANFIMRGRHPFIWVCFFKRTRLMKAQKVKNPDKIRSYEMKIKL